MPFTRVSVEVEFARSIAVPSIDTRYVKSWQEAAVHTLRTDSGGYHSLIGSPTLPLAAIAITADTIIQIDESA